MNEFPIGNEIVHRLEQRNLLLDTRNFHAPLLVIRCDLLQFLLFLAQCLLNLENGSENRARNRFNNYINYITISSYDLISAKSSSFIH